MLKRRSPNDYTNNKRAHFDIDREISYERQIMERLLQENHQLKYEQILLRKQLQDLSTEVEKLKPKEYWPSYIG